MVLSSHLQKNCVDCDLTECSSLYIDKFCVTLLGLTSNSIDHLRENTKVGCNRGPAM